MEPLISCSIYLHEEDLNVEILETYHGIAEGEEGERWLPWSPGIDATRNVSYVMNAVNCDWKPSAVPAIPIGSNIPNVIREYCY
jgi:hypothetical protein